MWRAHQSLKYYLSSNSFVSYLYHGIFHDTQFTINSVPQIFLEFLALPARIDQVLSLPVMVFVIHKIPITFVSP